MKIRLFLLLISYLIVCSCYQNNKTNGAAEMSEDEIQDSINVIVAYISDDWKFIKTSITDSARISLPELEKVNIQHWEKINTNEPVNQITISGMKIEFIESINTMQGWTYDDSANIEYRENQFGLYLTRGDSISGFVGISELNDSILELANGQKYSRIK